MRFQSLVCLVFWASVTSTAYAASNAEIEGLINAGQTQAAERELAGPLASHPGDARLRFLKAVVCRETGRIDEAIRLFSDLLQDGQDTVGVYNNLGVLYAAKGQYEKAATALRMSVSLRRDALTLQALGDLYSKLAAQAYAGATQEKVVDAPLALKLNPMLTGVPVESKVAGATLFVKQ